MSAVYTDADLAAAWDSGYWNGTSHTGPLNSAAVDAKNPYRNQAEDVRGTTPAKACRIRLKTVESRDVSPKSATASEPTNN